MTAAGSPMRSRRAPYRFLDPDHLAKEVATTAGCCNRWSDLEGLGMKFIATARQLIIQEAWPGAGPAAEQSDVGPVGNLLRFIRSEGYHSKRPEVHAAIEARVQAHRNRKIKFQLARKRNTRPVLDAKAEVARLIEDRIALRDVIDRGNEKIDRDVRATPDCEDVPVGLPTRWVNGLPIPVQSGKPRGSDGATSKTVLKSKKQTAAERMG